MKRRLGLVLRYSSIDGCHAYTRSSAGGHGARSHALPRRPDFAKATPGRRVRAWHPIHQITCNRALACAACALLLGLCGAAFCAGEPAVGVDAQTVHRNALELWRSSISPPTASSAPADLDQTASEVQAMTAVPKRPKPPATAPAKGANLAKEPADEPADDEGMTQSAPAAEAPLDSNTLERLKLAPPTGPVGKVALADSLFAHDQLESACFLYREALGQDPAGRDKDWILFQIGNCLRAKDAASARSFYQRVSAECPGSPWGAIAAVQCEVLDRQQAPATRPAAAAKTATPARAVAARVAAAPPATTTMPAGGPNAR
jgi:hypothetical protein